MRIAIYLSGIGIGNFRQIHPQLLQQFISTLIEERPQNQYALIGPVKYLPSANISQLEHVSFPRPTSSWYSKWKHHRQLKQWQKNWQPEVWITTHPKLTLAATNGSNWLLWHSDWQIEAFKFFIQPEMSFKANQKPGFRGILLAWEAQQAFLRKTLAENTSMLSIGSATLPGFQPATWASKTSTKTAVAGGQEYFLYVGNTDDEQEVISLLKSFSAFKKRQRSAMYLVIQTNGTTPSDTLQQKLKTFKYRHEVTLIGKPCNADELFRLAAGSYATIVPPDFCMGWWLLGLLQCETAIVCTLSPGSTEILGESAVFVEEWQEDLLAEAMMFLYKEEAQRGHLILEGSMRLAAHSWRRMAERVWNGVETSGQVPAPI